jgi:hypothetical protein
MNILEKDLKPLTSEELVYFKNHYTQNFDNMSVSSAVYFFKMLINNTTDKSLYDDEKYSLLVRRLNMIIDFHNYPERLL